MEGRTAPRAAQRDRCGMKVPDTARSFPGVPLIDGKWRYGGRIDQIAASIYEGRPNGMPAWRTKLTDQQIWQLAAYVRSLSGQVRKDAVGARTDTMSTTPPNTETVLKPIKPADSAQQ